MATIVGTFVGHFNGSFVVQLDCGCSIFYTREQMLGLNSATVEELEFILNRRADAHKCDEALKCQKL